MPQPTRKAKAAAKNRREGAAQKKLYQSLDAAFGDATAKLRGEEDAERHRQQRQLWKEIKAAQGDPRKRELSQLKFTHWWKEKQRSQYKCCAMPLDEAKAAVIYEAMRRRPEVRRAWLDGKFLFHYNGWQTLTGFVVNHLPQPWPELSTMTRGGIVEAMLSPLFIPPKGYSNFPDNKAKQAEVSMHLLRLPASDDPAEAQAFLRHARRWADAGFLIVALDKKQNQAVRAAFEAIAKLPPTFRSADLKPIMLHRLPPNVSAGDERALEQKKRRGTLTGQDFDKLWSKYIQPTTNPLAPWHHVAEGREEPMHKSTQRGKLMEEKRFKFESICGQLEDLDSGKISRSDFVDRLRL